MQTFLFTSKTKEINVASKIKFNMILSIFVFCYYLLLLFPNESKRIQAEPKISLRITKELVSLIDAILLQHSL